MPKAGLNGRAAYVLAVVAIPLMSGCAQDTQITNINDTSSSYAGTVSAREYGFVRPAPDVRMSAADTGRRSRAHGRLAGGDLWMRVRAGMRLDLHADSRIDNTLASFKRDPRYLEKMSERASPYLPQIVSEIERRGLPMELALLPHVESRYNPSATSPKAAAGMWQFMPYTAREMGLRLDRGTDERRDVTASTRAAMDYLEQLNQRFGGDWELAMAAYNCGPGRVESAIAANRRSGRATDFWSLDLPNETRQYVPQILASARLVAESQRGGQRLPATASLRPMEMIRSSEPLDLVRLAASSGVSLSQLRELNPSLKVDRSSNRPITQLFVPAGAGARISARSERVSVIEMASGSVSARAAVRLHQRQPRFAQESETDGADHIVKNGETLASVALRYGLDLRTLAEVNGMSSRDPLLPGQTLRIPSRKTPDILTHRVRKGDSIAAIARLYGVTSSDIRRWNHIADNRVSPGSTLRIYRKGAASSS